MMRRILCAVLLSLSCSAVIALQHVSFADEGPIPSPPKPEAPSTTETLKEKTGQFKNSFKKLFGKKEAEAPASETPSESSVTGTSSEKPPSSEVPAQPPFFPVPEAQPTVTAPVLSTEAPPDFSLNRLTDTKNPFGLTSAKLKLEKAVKLHETPNMNAQALAALTELKNWLVPCVENHMLLYQTLAKVPGAKVQSDLEKQVALEFASVRDEALYWYGAALVKAGRSKEAIEPFMAVILSQPRREFGLKAYEQLQKMGFTERVQVNMLKN
ncbi:MAG: hypothetical protein ACKO37_02275 [Vampirovibrionales bacterium]